MAIFIYIISRVMFREGWRGGLNSSKQTVSDIFTSVYVLVHLCLHVIIVSLVSFKIGGQ